MSACSSFSYSCYYLCLLVVALFYLCISNANLDGVLCNKGERLALLEFKHGLVDETDRLASWVVEESDCCRWAGIVCDNVTGHVNQIHLQAPDAHCYYGEFEVSDHRLRGSLSSSLKHLKQLKHLDLSCNDFEGTSVPKFIGSLGNLRYLNLSSSNFSGIIPPQLGNLTEVRVISLTTTHESTSIINMQWLSGLRWLHHLDMSGVDLSKATAWLQVINTLPSLVELRMSDCQLSNINPYVSSLNITSLSLLDLSGNYFNSTLPQWIFSITSLVSLDLDFCSFHGPVPSSSIDSLRNMTSLESLQLNGNDFMNSSLVLKGLSSIGGKLISLDIGSCGVSSSVLDSLNNLTSLLSLGLSDNQLTKTIPKSLCNFCNLKEIDLSSNEYLKTSLHSVDLLESFFKCKTPALESLLLGSLGLSGNLPSQLEQLVRLEHLKLDTNNISGTIPDSIGQLSSLRTLDLSMNLIFGRIPHSIGRLIHLEYLKLDNNHIVGMIPDSIGSLSFVRLLDLSVNQISGSIPHSIGQLMHLEDLLLDDNHISGTIPDSIGRLSFLRTLDLSRNQISGPIPFSIGQLSSLELLRLSSNQLNGSLPDSIGGMSSLRSLYLSNNQLTGVVTETHFVKLVNLIVLYGEGNNLILRLRLANWIPPFHLQELNLNSWSLGPRFPLWLHSQNDLRSLDIRNTSISSTMPRELFWRSFPNLFLLDMSHNHIQGTLTLSSIPATVSSLDLSFNEFSGNLPHLSNGSFPRLLDLSNNFFEGSLHHLLCPYEKKDLEVLNIGNNHLSGVIPNCWEKWPKLALLSLENNNLSGGIPRTLGSLNKLQSLNMHGNRLSGRLPSSLMNLTYLKILQLGENRLVGSIPTWLGKEVSFLRLVDLRSNYFNGNVPPELCHLTHLQILDLANNNLSGNIPRCFNNFSVLSGKSVDLLYNAVTVFEKVFSGDSLVIKGHEYTYITTLGLVMLLDLSCNNLVGHIPSELTTLLKLKFLNLSRNQLTGKIPEKIGDMKELESFDLSLNKLSGELPISLSSLNSLSSFNVSYNNFSGSVPLSTQLQSLDKSCFVGNNLCGDPLIERCARAEAPDTSHEEHDSHGADWGFIISMVLGFIAGFWVILAPLIVSRSWRIAYFRYLGDLRYMVYDVMHKYRFNMF